MENHKRNYREEDENPQGLKRVFLGPVEDVKPLEIHEIGIKAGVKGVEIKQSVDRAIHKLVYRGFPRVTLKAIGNACSKLLSIADILRRGVKDLSQVHSNYSRKYISKFESDDVRRH